MFSLLRLLAKGAGKNVSNRLNINLIKPTTSFSTVTSSVQSRSKVLTINELQTIPGAFRKVYFSQVFCYNLFDTQIL